VGVAALATFLPLLTLSEWEHQAGTDAGLAVHGPTRLIALRKNLNFSELTIYPFLNKVTKTQIFLMAATVKSAIFVLGNVV